MATPRTPGRMPIQRWRPALPIVSFIWSRMVRSECMATIGAVSNPDHMNETIGLADRLVHMVRVRYRANGRHALGAHHAGFAGLQFQQSVALIAADELCV